MPKPYKGYHKEKMELEEKFRKEKEELETKEHMATARTVLQLVKIAAESATNFEEFTNTLNDALIKLEEKMDK